MPDFIDRLQGNILSRRTPALIGLDPRWELLPTELRGDDSRPSTSKMAEAFQAFCTEVIDIVAPLVPAVKPQVAFFEQLGPAGMVAVDAVMQHARRQGLIVIADAKRGDIGSTAEAYADAWLDGDSGKAAFAADALTVNPYLGDDTLQPFIDMAAQRNAGIYVLVRTSNPGAKTFQDKTSDGTTLYETVADSVQQFNADAAGTDRLGFVGAVVGATWPAELKALRSRMPNTPFLVPGYGSQGGTADDVAPAFHGPPAAALVNSSRAINFAWHRPEWKDKYPDAKWRDAVHAATQKMVADLPAVENNYSASR